MSFFSRAVKFVKSGVKAATVATADIYAGFPVSGGVDAGNQIGIDLGPLLGTGPSKSIGKNSSPQIIYRTNDPISIGWPTWPPGPLDSTRTKQAGIGVGPVGLAIGVGSTVITESIRWWKQNQKDQLKAQKDAQRKRDADARAAAAAKRQRQAQAARDQALAIRIQDIAAKNAASIEKMRGANQIRQSVEDRANAAAAERKREYDLARQDRLFKDRVARQDRIDAEAKAAAAKAAADQKAMDDSMRKQADEAHAKAVAAINARLQQKAKFNGEVLAFLYKNFLQPKLFPDRNKARTTTVVSSVGGVRSVPLLMRAAPKKRKKRRRKKKSLTRHRTRRVA